MGSPLAKADFTDKFFSAVRLQLQMLKVFFLIFESGVTWEKIARAGRGYAYVFATHLLPMILLATVAEGWGLSHWGKWQPRFQKIKEFPIETVITFEVLQALLFLAMVMLCAQVVMKIGLTFEKQRTYLQTFSTMAYAFSPFFLVQTLNALPKMSPWVTWSLGIALTFWVLYMGIPLMLRPDPTHAFGLYLSTIIVVLLASAVARILPALYLIGRVDFHHSWLTHKFPGLFQ
jgi:exosortase/archaeosortase